VTLTLLPGINEVVAGDVVGVIPVLVLKGGSVIGLS
jgi:hypothetical protein